MYKTVKGIYKKGKIIPVEPVNIDQNEVEVIITFIKNDSKKEKIHLQRTNCFIL